MGHKGTNNGNNTDTTTGERYGSPSLATAAISVTCLSISSMLVRVNASTECVQHTSTPWSMEQQAMAEHLCDQHSFPYCFPFSHLT